MELTDFEKEHRKTLPNGVAFGLRLNDDGSVESVHLNTIVSAMLPDVSPKESALFLSGIESVTFKGAHYRKIEDSGEVVEEIAYRFIKYERRD